MAKNIQNLAENSVQNLKPKVAIKSSSARMSLPAHRAFRKQVPKKAGYLSQILSSRVCRSPGLLLSSAVILVGGSLIRK
jgi:hypothetical protein